jgi:hypothetical protein
MPEVVVALLVLSGSASLLFRTAVPMEPDAKARKQSDATNTTTTTTKIHKSRSSSTSVEDYLAQEFNASTSPACQPRLFERNKRPIRRIFFLHMRKAGGTVIRKYLKKVAALYGLEYQAREGRKTAKQEMDPHTLYVTNLREPNARTISNYKYDQRWHCQKLKKSSFVPSLNNTRQSFETFLYNGGRHNGQASLWTCATNCYTRWASGDYKPLSKTCSSKLRKKEIKRIREACNQLSKYNFIFIAEHLRDPHYIQNVERMFGVSGLAKRKRYPACAKVSAQANAKIPLELSNETRHHLEECNIPDTALYRQMTTCPQGFDFSQFNMSVFVNSSMLIGAYT